MGSKKTKSFLFVRNIWAFIFVIIVFVMLASHLIAFFTFSRYTQTNQLQINRGIAARQIITLIEAVEINPPDKRKYVVDAIDIPNVRLTLDHYPKYHIRVSQLHIWDVLLKIRQIPPKTRVMQISVRLGSKEWLNISTSIFQSSWNFQFFLLGYELLILLALILIGLLMNRFNRPLKRFVQSVKKMGDTPFASLEVLSEDDGPPMVREAAKAINQMQRKIRELMQNRIQMLAALSHDLRTPLTRLKLRAQFLEDENLQLKITNDLTEMEVMINESLRFFRDEQQALPKSNIDFAELLSSLCRDYYETKRPVRYIGPKQGVDLSGNASALRRAFANIIDNALKYGNKAEVTLEEKRGQCIVTVEDEGKGISKTDVEKVFVPFYRGEQSRSRETGGIGLGLAVTRHILNVHHGEITLSMRKPHGLKVIVALSVLEH